MAMEASRVQNHLDLLREQYRKLQARHAELQKKADAGAANGAPGSTFVGQLQASIADLFESPTFSDVNVVIEGRIVPAHKLVLAVRGKWLSSGMKLEAVDTVSLDGVEYAVGFALLRWAYTQQLSIRPGDIEFGVAVLLSSFEYGLPDLQARCEQCLMSEVNTGNCVSLLTTANEVDAEELKQFTMSVVMNNWTQLPKGQFASLSAELLYELIKNKSQFPLHEAILHGREDVVFLYLVEHDLELPTKINELDDNGKSPLLLALAGKHDGLASTLVAHKCNLDARQRDGLTMLHASILGQDPFSATFLIERGASVSLLTPDKKSALHLAAEKNMPEVALLLLKHRADINAQDSLANTPIQTAIVCRNAEMVSLFLGQPEANVNSRNAQGHTALWMALSLEDQSFAKTLVSRGCDINLCDSAGDSMLHDAIRGNKQQSALFLIDNGAAVGLANNARQTPLHVAAESGARDVVEQLLARNAPVNAADAQMRTPLMVALGNRQPAVVAQLLAQPAIDLNAQDAEGKTVLALSIEAGQLDVAEQLIGSGASVQGQLPSGLTLLHSAIMRSDVNGAIFLLRHGSSVNARTADNRTPMQLAIDHSVPRVVDALCSMGAVVDEPDDSGTTPLWQALRAKQEDIAVILVRHECDVNAKDEGGYTALHLAIRQGDEFSSRFLIRNGANVDDAENPEGKTPLHLAAELGFLPLVGELVNQNATVNAQDAEKQTALHKAIYAKQLEIAAFLVQHPKLDLRLRNKLGHTVFGAAFEVKDANMAVAILSKRPKATEEVNARGMTYLHTALTKSSEEGVQFLLRLGADVNTPVKDSSARTPLSIAVERGDNAIVNSLLQAGANHSIPDRQSKWTVAHVAASLGFEQIIQSLVRFKADMNAVDDLGETVLHAAVRAGHAKVVRRLLAEAKVKVEATNNVGQTALHILARYPKQSAVEILQVLHPHLTDLNPQDAEGDTPLYHAYTNAAAMLCRALVANGGHLGLPNKHGGSCFDVKVPSKKLLYKLLELVPKEQEWVEAPFCQVCQQKFGMSTRKHHCRHCGRVLCKKCSSKQAPIPKFGLTKPVRLCDECHVVIGQ